MKFHRHYNQKNCPALFGQFSCMKENLPLGGRFKKA